MILSAHVAAGALAGMAGAASTRHRIRRIAVAFLLGLVSHALLDAIPHSDYRLVAPSSLPWVALGELTVISAVLTVLLRDRVGSGWAASLSAGIIGAGIADAKFVVPVLRVPALTDAVSRAGNAVHGHFHASPPSSPLIGLAVEIAVTLLLVAGLAAFPRRRALLRNRRDEPTAASGGQGRGR